MERKAFDEALKVCLNTPPISHRKGQVDKESIYLLQCVDCNCNNCGYFERDIPLTNERNTNPGIVACKIHYGKCTKFNKVVGEIANIALLHTQSCFVHRKDMIAK